MINRKQNKITYTVIHCLNILLLQLVVSEIPIQNVVSKGVYKGIVK